MTDPRDTPPVTGWMLTSSTCTARVIAAGAMLQDVVFAVGKGAGFRPFAPASWSEPARQGQVPDQPLHLTHLGGEWPCVPFGSSDADPEHHGFGSNHLWRCDHATSNAITLSIDYPDDHKVRRLIRCISVSENDPAITCSLTVEVREACGLPIGLHPIFRLPADGRVVLDVDGATNWAAIPDPYRPEGARISGGGAAGLIDAGGTAVTFVRDFTSYRAELVQAFDLPGRVGLIYPDDGVRVSLMWDAQKLPHCLFWLANPHDFPGLGPFRGLGVEPVASWFDRGCTPKAEAGGTANGTFGVELTPDAVWTLDYKITAEALGQNQGDRP